ncbi:glycosyltransferase family 39 protein [Desulfonatronum sp. SC1]|uniref:glycosyltransferase family 39 protein n=1 Tax=Desulfonatronum sp. SC1 TaxID=2109626 RepID=UPI0013050105|nr:glycosyltransferase family 39 protein [Desulfonatronum sp. SC1]
MSLRPKIQKTEALLPLALIVLTALGCWLRFSQLSALSLWIDEGFSLAAARGILEHGVPRLADGSLAWNYFPAHYLMALGTILFQDLEFGARFFSALAGTVLIPAYYLFVRRLTHCPWTALLAAGLLALLSYEVSWSRQARSYVLLQLLTILSLTAFLRFQDSPGRWSIMSALGLGGLAVLTHPAGYLAFLYMALCLPLGIRSHRFLADWLRDQRIFFMILTVLLLLAAILVMLSGSNSGIAATIQRLGRDHAMNYSGLYLFFLQAQFGYLLPWAAVGMVLTAVKLPRTIIPLIICMVAYFVLISWYTMLFHFRYALPLFLFIPLFVGYGIVAPMQWLLRVPSLARKAGAVLLCVLFLAGLSTARLDFTPQPHPDLGFTAPTAPWREACHWIRVDHAAGGGISHDLVTVSAFPMFHDFYLDGQGQKYFLPHSLSGYPGHERDHDPHAGAETIHKASRLAAMQRGYVFLDDFGLRMIKNKGIRTLLERTPPVFVARGPWGFDVFVWRLPLSS